MPKDSSTYIEALDGLRAIAIILVLARHAVKRAVEIFPEALVHFQIGSYNILTVFMNGWVGVDLFFVLSGFLIARPLLKDKKISLKNYAMKRILRIVPAYFTILILCLVGFFPLYEPDTTTKSILFHFLFLQDVTGSDINVVFWSLGVEEKFYILAPVLLMFLSFLVNNKKFKLISTITMMLFIASMYLRIVIFENFNGEMNYTEFFYYLRSPFYLCFEPIIMGIAIAFYERYGNRIKEDSGRKIRLLSFVALLVLLASHELMYTISIVDVTIQPVIIAVIMGGIVLGTVIEKPDNWLKAGIMKYISKLSYSLYLVHWPLIPIAGALAIYMTNTLLWNVSSYLFLYLLFTYIAALMLHHFVEKPFLKLKEKY